MNISLLFQGEKEVLLFPFTFAKILSINSEVKFGEEIKIVNLEIINRKSYLEYILRDNVEKRPRFAGKAIWTKKDWIVQEIKEKKINEKK